MIRTKEAIGRILTMTRSLSNLVLYAETWVSPILISLCECRPEPYESLTELDFVTESAFVFGVGVVCLQYGLEPSERRQRMFQFREALIINQRCDTEAFSIDSEGRGT